MKINSGAVLSSLPDDAHVLAVDSGGGLRRLTPSGLRNDVKDSMGLSKTTNINVTKGQWVRIAQGPYTQSPFVGLVGVSHYYEAGLPQNALLAVSGTGWTEAAFKATPLVAWADPSFDAVRLVKEDGDTLYVEVRFSKKKTQYIYTTIAANNRLTLTDATVSMATADKVLKTIDLHSGGVMRCITAGYDSLCAPRQKGGHHERGYEDSRLPEVAPGGCLSFESLDSLCDFIGRASEEHDSHSDPDNSDMRRHERGGRGVHAHKHGDFEPPHERRRRLRADAPLRRCSQDADILWMGAREAVHAQEELISGRQFMGCLEGDSVRVIAGRKEVAYV